MCADRSVSKLKPATRAGLRLLLQTGRFQLCALCTHPAASICTLQGLGGRGLPDLTQPHPVVQNLCDPEPAGGHSDISGADLLRRQQDAHSGSWRSVPYSTVCIGQLHFEPRQDVGLLAGCHSSTARSLEPCLQFLAHNLCSLSLYVPQHGGVHPASLCCLMVMTTLWMT